MNNNYSYITLLSDDSYIYGIILLQESLRRVNTKYPLKVLITSNVSKPILEIIKQLNLGYQIIEPIIFQKLINYNKDIHSVFAKTWALCLSKLEIFNQTQYDKLVFLDADILVLKNLDHLFEYPHLTSAIDGEYFNLWPNNPHFNSGIMVIKPNKEEYLNLINFVSDLALDETNKIQCVADQEILNMYYSDWYLQENLHLNKYYDVFAPYIQEEQINDIDENCYFIHFIGRKPWRGFFKGTEETYTEKYYNDARNIISTVVNSLDWDAAKAQIKIAVYAICKDEIENIEKFIHCFSVADYLCILDTGSTDGTWEYLQTMKQSYSNLIIDQKIVNPWRYDTARNLSLQLVPDDTVMYFMVDLDEIIKEDNWIFYMKACWDPLFSRGGYMYNRRVDKNTDAIIQNFKEYRIHSKIWHYKGIVHEQLYDIADSRGFSYDEVINIPITVWHYPLKPNREIYIELCERGVQEEPDNWIMHLQLAAEYEVHEQYEKAIEEYRNIIIKQNTLLSPEIGRCYTSLGRALHFTGKTDEGLQIMARGRELVPDYGDNYFLAAEIYYMNNNFEQAYLLCEQGLRNCKENYWCTIINTNSYYPYLIMGMSQFFLNNKVLGLGYLAIAKSKNDDDNVNNAYQLVINDINGGE